MSAPSEQSDSDTVRALTAQVHSASETLAALSRELSRSRIVTRLVKSTQRLGIGMPIADDLALRFLQVVIEQTLCDTVALLRNRSGTGVFVTVQAIGHALQSQSEELNLQGIPPFVVLPGGGCPSHVSAELRRAYGTGSVLWSLHTESGLGLLLYSKPAATIRQAFNEADRELLETALSVYVQLLADRNLKRNLAQAKQSAESRLGATRTMTADLLHLLGKKLDLAAAHLLNAEARLDGVTGLASNADLHEASCLISEASKLVGVSTDVVGTGDIPLNLELSWGKVDPVIRKVCAAHDRFALERGIHISVVPKPGGVFACFDVGWVSEIFKRILLAVLDEAHPGTTVRVDHARRSDGLISITVSWRSVEFSGSRPALTSEFVCELPLSSWERDEVVRLVDAYGGTLTHELKDIGCFQVTWAFSPNE